ncbi:Transcription elongation factor GreB [Sodalis praecaptivus]
MKSNLITRQGYRELHDELDHLWKRYRPEITEKVAWAASLGDRSENADYHYNKKILREIDRRVRYLRRVLKEARVVDYSPQQEGRVFLAPGWRWKARRGRQNAFVSPVPMKSTNIRTTFPSTRLWRAL